MKNRVVWLTLGGAALATGLICWGFWSVMLAPLDRAVKTANAVHDGFVRAMNLTPRILVSQTVVYAENSPTLELVTAERSALVQHRLTETWLHSTKEFEIEAKFTAKAGLLLRDVLVVNIPRGGKTAEITLPRAKILSMEMADFRILRDEDGLWNKLTPKDRERAIRDLNREARKDFEATDLLEKAAGEAKARISEIVTGAGVRVVFKLPSDQPKS